MCYVRYLNVQARSRSHVKGQIEILFTILSDTVSLKLLYHLAQVSAIISRCVANMTKVCMSKVKITGHG